MKRWRKPLVSLAVASIALVAGEGLHRLWLSAQGHPYSREAVRAQIANLRNFTPNFLGYLDGPEDRSGERLYRKYRGTSVLHPYLGFEAPRYLDQTVLDLTRQQEAPGDLRVLILGGSVAGHFCNHGRARLTELLEADPRSGGRRVRFLRYGLAASKQPQQLMRLSYLLSLGIRPDLVIEIDGFNEVAIGNENAMKGMHPIYPRRNMWLSMTVEPTVNLEAAVCQARVRDSRQVLERECDRAEASPLLYVSLLGRVVLARLNERRAAILGDSRAYLAALRDSDVPRHLLGPPFVGDEAAAIDETVRIWRESSLSMHSLCEIRGLAFLLVLQPALHDEGSKTLTKSETVNGASIGPFWRRGVRQGFPKLRESAVLLRNAGVAFLDASRLFSKVEETLFLDAVHFTDAGARLMAEAIGPRALDLLFD